MEYNVNSIIERYNACLVAKGYTQPMKYILINIYPSWKNEYNHNFTFINGKLWIGHPIVQCKECLRIYKVRWRHL